MTHLEEDGDHTFDLQMFVCYAALGEGCDGSVSIPKLLISIE
jgi:hypothetical protein